LDFLSDPRYAVRALSAAIVETPNMYSMLSDMGLFPERGIAVTYVEIEIKKGSLSVIPMSTRGAPAPHMTRDRSSIRMLPTFFMQMNDTLRPSDLQNLRAFGTTDIFESFDNLLAERMAKLLRMYRMSHEYMRWMALMGDVTDPATGQRLYNCYQEMGESQAAFDFKFGSTTDNAPLAATKAVRRYYERERRGEPMSGLAWFASSEFMDKLTSHPAYIKMYEQQQAIGALSNHPLFEDHEIFKVGNNVFIEHNGYATLTLPDKTQQEKIFIAPGEAVGVPLGTVECFASYFAPGEMMSAVNMPGLAMYTSLKVLDHEAGIEVHTESAPIAVVQKPRLVIRGHSSN
jgi:hypothetical protein